MRDDDLAVVRAGYEAFGRRDLATLLEHMHEELELHTQGEGIYRGHDGLRQWFADMDAAWETWSVGVEEIIDAGPRAIVVALVSARSRLHKLDSSLRFWVVWEVIDGKAAIGLHLTDLESALAAARAPVRSRAPSG